jgi:hypothetical protein
VVTVIVALPAETALTVPLLTVATALLLLLQNTFLLVALLGLTVALSVSLPPTVKDRLDLLRLTLETFTVLLPEGVMVTAQVAVLFPSVVVAVIVAVPADIPITVPVEETVATLEALLLHNTTLFAASAGMTVALKVSEAPTVMLADALFKNTSVTETAVVEMVTLTLLLLLLSAVEVAMTIRLKAVSSFATLKRPLALMLVSPPPPKTNHVTV